MSSSSKQERDANSKAAQQNAQSPHNSQNRTSPRTTGRIVPAPRPKRQPRENYASPTYASALHQQERAQRSAYRAPAVVNVDLSAVLQDERPPAPGSQADAHNDSSNTADEQRQLTLWDRASAVPLPVNSTRTRRGTLWRHILTPQCPGITHKELMRYYGTESTHRQQLEQRFVLWEERQNREQWMETQKHAFRMIALAEAAVFQTLEKEAQHGRNLEFVRQQSTTAPALRAAEADLELRVQQAWREHETLQHIKKELEMLDEEREQEARRMHASITQERRLIVTQLDALERETVALVREAEDNVIAMSLGPPLQLPESEFRAGSREEAVMETPETRSRSGARSGSEHHHATHHGRSGDTIEAPDLYGTTPSFLKQIVFDVADVVQKSNATFAQVADIMSGAQMPKSRT